ncbi:MAG: polymer-forming cytoskeletal protein [Xanthomonadales bacterium]|nr:polymer-forming cytoskeletal protein [Gammaproteobacteria bacterium]MBT8052531.1 polymer-forming cytoskeletal protein [Gammaproteobacteria bacterium]NND57095.1 polymer-forming cytoskeletal protein [Xanthomonadales bacterium]
MFDKHKSGKQTPPVAEEPRASTPVPAKSTATAASNTKVAMIGQGISISGDVNADSSLKVEGRIEGRSVQCSGEVEVAETGHVIANIIGKLVRVSGDVSGDIGGSERVIITKTGRVQGNIIAPRVQLEDGALFRGSIDMNPAQKAGADKPAAVKQPAANKSVADSGQKVADAPAANPTASHSSAAKDTARKEPSLNLKSG